MSTDPLHRLGKDPILLCFGARWCQVWSLLEKQLKENDISYRSVDIDEHPHIAEQFRIVSLPTVVLMIDNKERKRHTGAIGAQDAQNLLGPVKSAKKRRTKRM